MLHIADEFELKTEANLKTTFKHARKLVQAKDIHEVMQLQSEFVRSQFASATDQFKHITNTTAAASKDAVNKTNT